MRGGSLGAGLTRRLIEAARERDVEHFCALVLRENEDMPNLLQNLDLPEHARWEDDFQRVDVDLQTNEA